MDFEIRWTLPAATDFEELAGKTTEESDAIQCDEVVSEIFESVEGLKVHPHIEEQLEKYPQLRCRLVSGFRIIYQVFEEEQVVEITRLLHQRQDIKRAFGLTTQRKSPAGPPRLGQPFGSHQEILLAGMSVALRGRAFAVTK